MSDKPQQQSAYMNAAHTLARRSSSPPPVTLQGICFSCPSKNNPTLRLKDHCRGAQAKVNHRIDGDDTRDVARGSARRSSPGGLRDSGGIVNPSTDPERCSPDREIGYARPREHPGLPRQPSQHDQQLLREVSWTMHDLSLPSS